MSKLRPITERMLEAFIEGGGIVDDCGCGVTHVFTHNNGGSFDEGELERYEAKAKENPRKYRFHDYSSSSSGHVACQKFVMDCTCLEGRFGKWANFMWDNRESIIRFVINENAARAREVQQTEEQLSKL